MNRLGNALTPVALRVDTSPGAIDLDAAVVVCQTPVRDRELPAPGRLDLTFAAQAPADVDVAADLVKTMDGGANWTPLTSVGAAAGCRTVAGAPSRTSRSWTSP